MKSIFARYFYVSSATYGHNFGYQETKVNVMFKEVNEWLKRD